MANKIGILEADPTRFGGIQGFVRTLSGYLPSGRTFLVSYYADKANDKTLSCSTIDLNDRNSRSWLTKFICSRKGWYLSGFGFKRNLALLLDLFIIRRNLQKEFSGGDTLVLNSASSMMLFCTKKVLENNRIVLVQHNDPQIMSSRKFDFGGFFRSYKIKLFKRFVDDFVMLSPLEKAEFSKWLPLDGKNCHVIRHSVPFPDRIPESEPPATAVLARLVPQKRIDRVIACAELLPEIRFNIYGSGPQEDELKKRAGHLRNIFFCGYTDDIDDVFEKNSILLITSDYEGYNIGGIEAAVRGRAVVVLNTYCAAGDLVCDNVSGKVVKDLSPEALAKAIKDVFAELGRYRAGAMEHRQLYAAETAGEKWISLLCPEQKKFKSENAAK